MDRKIFDKIEADQMKKRPEVKVGDTVKLSMKIKEGNKERTQIFEGVVIAKSGTGLNTTITVRKISYGIGVERIIPLHTPTMQKIEVVKRGNTKRAKLFYMREKIGKRALDVSGSSSVYFTDEADEVIEEAKTEDVTSAENTEATENTENTNTEENNSSETKDQAEDKSEEKDKPTEN